MDSAFLVFDLVGGEAGLKRKRDSRCSSIQNLMTLKKRSGLSSEKRVNRVPAANASPNSTGRIRVIVRPGAGCYQYVVARIDFEQSASINQYEMIDRPAVALRSSDFKRKSDINRILLRAAPFILPRLRGSLSAPPLRANRRC